jgi:hypothetical protein
MGEQGNLFEKKGNLLTSFLPTIGGIGGRVLGSIAAPGIGTAAGGAAGAGLGKTIQNMLLGKQDATEGVAGEAVLGSVGGIGKAFKAVKGAGQALKAGEGLSKAANVLRYGKSADVLAKGAQAVKAGSDVAKTPFLEKARNALTREGTLSPKSTIKTASEQNRLIDLVKRNPNLKGSAFNKFQNVEPEIKRAVGSVDDLLGSVKGSTVSSQKLGDIARKVVNEIPDPKEAQRFTTEFINTANNTFKGKIPEAMTPNDLNSLVRKVNSQLTKTFKKIDVGTQLTDKDEALLKMRDMLTKTTKDLLPSNVKNQYGAINKDISTLISGIPEFKAAGEQSLTVFGNAIPGLSKGVPRAAQSVADKAARMLGGVSTAASGAASSGVGGMIKSNFKPVASQLLARGLTGNLGSPSSTQSAPSDYGSMMSGAGVTGGAGTSSGVGGSGVGGTMYTREAAMADLQNDLATTGGANIDKYMKLYGFANPEVASGSGSVNSTAANTIADMQSGIRNISDLKGEVSESGANFPVLGNLRSLNPFDAEAQGLNTRMKVIKQTIGKAMEGGVLRKEDEEKYKKMLPTMGDTDETALDKIDYIEQSLSAKLQDYMNLVGYQQ